MGSYTRSAAAPARRSHGKKAKKKYHPSAQANSNTAQNLTRVEDPLNQDEAPTLMAYDGNSNTVHLTDPDGKEMFFEWDYRRRLVRVENGLGLLSEVVDAKGRSTVFAYTPARQLWKIINALSEVTEFSYLPDGLLETIKDPAGNLVSYDDNGNMTGKPKGVDTWTYTWNEVENRLIWVQGPGSVDVNYTYDSIGRMLTRDDGTDLTQFTWDHHDMIREVTGESETTYCIPEGKLTSLIRDGNRYDVHTDHVMSVRMITDENGDVVFRKEFDAWGGELAGGFDSVPGGMPYGFVGASGCRKDPLTGLVYMRARWFEPQHGRFISRDPVGLFAGANLYCYCNDDPVNLVDPSGLDGTLTLNAAAGHAWLSYHFDNGPHANEDLTVGAWPAGNNDAPYDGVHRNIEKGIPSLKPLAQRSVKLNAEQERRFLKYVQLAVARDDWTSQRNCAYWATNSWEYLTGEKLANSSWRSAGVPAPLELARSMDPSKGSPYNTGWALTDASGSLVVNSSMVGSTSLGSISGAVSSGIWGSVNAIPTAVSYYRDWFSGR